MKSNFVTHRDSTKRGRGGEGRRGGNQLVAKTFIHEHFSIILGCEV